MDQISTEFNNLLQNSREFLAIYNGIWDARKTYAQIHGIAGHLFRRLADDESVSSNSISALMGFWYLKAKIKDDSPTPPLQGACALVAMAVIPASTLVESVAQRICLTYQSLVELEHGDRMDTPDEINGLKMLGKFIANVDTRQPSKEKLIGEALSKGFTSGTSRYDVFMQAYADESIQAKSRAGGKP